MIKYYKCYMKWIKNMLQLSKKINLKGLNSNQLKIIAMISMLIDHFGLVFFPKIAIFRYLGRLALPIYAYMIAEGCKYTRNRKRYLGIIAGMAIVFQLVYLIFMRSLYQGILVNFSFSIIAIYAIDSFIKNKKIINRILMAIILCAIAFIYLGLPKIFESSGFAIDYGVWALILPIIVYFTPKKLWRILLIGAWLIIMTLVSGKNMQWYSLFVLPLFALYNGTRGSKKLKYVFYIFYPLHLVIIYAIAYLIIFLT